MSNAIQCCWYCSIAAEVLLLSLFFLCVLFVFCWCWNNLFLAGRTQCTTSPATTTTTTTTQVSLSLEEPVHLRGPAIIQGDRAPMIIPIIHPGWPTLFANGGKLRGLKHDLRHMIFSLWIWELPRSKVPPRSNSAGRRGGQNTPHRAESPWQVRKDYFSIYLLLFVQLFLIWCCCCCCCCCWEKADKILHTGLNFLYTWLRIVFSKYLFLLLYSFDIFL